MVSVSKFFIFIVGLTIIIGLGFGYVKLKFKEFLEFWEVFRCYGRPFMLGRFIFKMPL